jgi:hypothetical protein
MEVIKKAEALQRMRALSQQNIPFSFGFFSFSASKETASTYKVVDKALLRSGLRQDQSEMHNILIAYTDYSDATDKPRHFHYPLLMMFNGQKVKP